MRREVIRAERGESQMDKSNFDTSFNFGANVKP
jgi:hypothetical protein